METYLPAPAYRVLTELILRALRNYLPSINHPARRGDPDDLHMSIHSALRLAGVDMGELVVKPPRIDPSKNLDLIAALMAIDTSPATGDFDGCAVKLVLGEVGNIWPDWLRAVAA